MAEREYTDLIVIHCADTKPSMMHINEDEIRNWHLARGWSDAGYNIVIPRQPTDDQHGLIEVARPIDTQGAHVAGYNHRALGICLVGGMSEDGEPEENFLQEQWEALHIALEFSLQYAPSAKICGHTDIDSGKTCPNFDVEEWCAEFDFPYGVPT
jgi:N-acetylmuramoyl-L-alanine amidase